MGIGWKGRERRKVMEKGQGKGTDTLQTDNVFTRKEYIEREAAIEEIENADVMCDIPADAYRVLRRYIDRIPAADVVPVRHGRWMEHKSWAKCSECGYLLGFETPYCPNCGARMDGDGK